MSASTCWLCDEHDGTEIAIAHFRVHTRCLRVLVNLIQDSRRPPEERKGKAR